MLPGKNHSNDTPTTEIEILSSRKIFSHTLPSNGGIKRFIFSYRLFEHVMSSGGRWECWDCYPPQTNLLPPSLRLKLSEHFLDSFLRTIWKEIFLGLKLPSSLEFFDSILKQITELYQHNIEICSLCGSIKLIQRPFLRVDDSFDIPHPAHLKDVFIAELLFHLIIIVRQLFNGIN